MRGCHLSPSTVVLDVGVAGQAVVLLPPAGVEQHAVSVVLVDRLDLLVAALVEGLGRGADVLLSII